jgi:hypothetical protein
LTGSGAHDGDLRLIECESGQLQAAREEEWPELGVGAHRRSAQHARPFESLAFDLDVVDDRRKLREEGELDLPERDSTAESLRDSRLGSD